MSTASETKRRSLIVGNWKMNGYRADAITLASALATHYRALSDPSFDLVLCPPATLVDIVATTVADSGVQVGGQNSSRRQKGAYTGDISAWGLADLGARYVIMGHSERRIGHHENDEIVKAKATAALEAGLIPIICVGETAEEHQNGKTLPVVASQISESLPDTATAESIVIAYEPIWAIGTGLVPTLEGVEAVHAVIRANAGLILKGGAAALRILYGGSVKAENAHAFLSLDDVDGALVGGASLIAEDFWNIAKAAL